MRHLIFTILVFSNIAVGIEVAADLDSVFAGSDHSDNSRLVEDGSAHDHGDDVGANGDHCGHAAGHFLGFAASLPVIEPPGESTRFAFSINSYNHPISAPPVPPNI